MRYKTATLTDQELEIMKIVWEIGPVTVRDVYEELLKHRKIAYTTVMTMMGVLERKGRLKKTSEDRAYVYSAVETRSKVVGSMVRDFVQKVFNGSAKPLLVHLAEDRQISPKELEEIQKILKQQQRRKS
jgi:predicted transcriptional regulator